MPWLFLRKKKCRRITLIKSVSQPRRLASRRDLNFTCPRANDGVLVPFLYQSPRSRSRRVSYLKVPINKEERSALWKHCREKHNSEIQQFQMNIAGVYSNDAMLRQISEGIKINNVDED